jgi:hypothetical protein
LLPDLNTHTNNRAFPDSRRKETKIADILGLTSDAYSFADLFHLSNHNRTIEITASVKVGKVVVRLFPTIMLSKPSRRLGEEEQASEEDETWDGLDSPCDAEGSWSINSNGAPVRDEIHDQDTW